jgi:hypothetical protein
MACSCRRTWRRDGDEDRRSRWQIAASILVKSVARGSDGARDHQPVQSLAFGSRQDLPRDRPCLSLYERIPAGSSKDYDRQFIAQERSKRSSKTNGYQFHKWRFCTIVSTATERGG